MILNRDGSVRIDKVPRGKESHMCAEKNKYNFRNLTKEQRAEMSKKAAEARKVQAERRRTMKECLNVLLGARIKENDFSLKALKKAGFDTKGLDYQTAMLMNVIRVAMTDNKNVVNAATFLRDTVGEKPTEKQMQVQTDYETYLEKVEDKDEWQ